MKVRRFRNNPIIHPNMDDRMGDNINGSSLIRVPEWIPNALGRYYLYFAHHQGTYIRMAYANSLVLGECILPVCLNSVSLSLIITWPPQMSTS